MTEYTPFSVSQEIEIAASPERVWDAITMHPEGWLWPMDPIEPRLGGSGPFGSVVTRSASAWTLPCCSCAFDENVVDLLSGVDMTVSIRA